MVNRNKELAVNTLILGIGQLIPKFLTLIILPILTTYLQEEEFGVYDLILSFASFLIPVITLQIQQAVFRFILTEEEFKKKNEEKKVEDKKGNENEIIVKKFRSAFDFSKADYSDEYILDLIIKSKKDFQRAMMLHLEIEDAKKEEKKNKSKTNEGLDQLVAQFRKEYQLSEQDYSNEKLKTVLSKKQGNFENAFEELMSFIE